MAVICMDVNGRFYKADKPKDSSDATYPLATQEMYDFLTETPCTFNELQQRVNKAQLEKEVPSAYTTPESEESEQTGDKNV